jgi:hypothetical protein
MNPFSASPSPSFTAKELEQFQKYFAQLDTDRKGIVTPQQTVAFLTKSLLDTTILSQVRSCN